MKIENNVLLSKYSYMGIGPRVSYFCEVKTIEELCEAITVWQTDSRYNRLRLVVLAEGTNMLLCKKTARAFVIKISLQSIIPLSGSVIFAQSGVLFKDVVDQSLAMRCEGLGWAGGLPGTVGGAVRGNAGAFGGETKDSVQAVLALVINKKNCALQIVVKDECEFSYRSSLFKTKNKKNICYIIVGVYFALTKVKSIKAETKKRDACIAYRMQRHPMQFPTLGSTFKNIPVKHVAPSVRAQFKSAIKNDPFLIIPVAAVLDSLSFKGVCKGGACFSTMHPNFIINTAKATSADVRWLIAYAKKKVKKAYGIDLEEEIEIVF